MFVTLDASAITLFSLLNGDSIHDIFVDLYHFSPLVSSVYLYSFICLFIYAVLNIAIAIVEDAFFASKAFQLQIHEGGGTGRPGDNNGIGERSNTQFSENRYLNGSGLLDLSNGSGVRDADDIHSLAHAKNIPHVHKQNSFHLLDFSPLITHTPHRKRLRSKSRVSKQKSTKEQSKHVDNPDASPLNSQGGLQDEGGRRATFRRQLSDSSMNSNGNYVLPPPASNPNTPKTPNNPNKPGGILVAVPPRVTECSAPEMLLNGSPLVRGGLSSDAKRAPREEGVSREAIQTVGSVSPFSLAPQKQASPPKASLTTLEPAREIGAPMLQALERARSDTEAAVLTQLQV